MIFENVVLTIYFNRNKLKGKFKMENNVELFKFESNVQWIKYNVLKEVSKLAFQDEMENLVHIPNIIVPGPKPITRCCIYHEREVVTERVKMALGGNKNIDNVIEVLDAACDECPVERYRVTEACRGCLSHKCQQACPFGAISFENQKAHINQDICKECGRCKEACPYNAIADVQRPCIKACKAGALSINENKKASIDNEKCVQCGACVYACPFGAIMDKSYIVDVINLLKERKNNKDLKIYAVIAPAIASQFSFATIGQVVNSIKKLGFHHVIEAALGADIVAEHETEEFVEVSKEKGLMTSSCCPAFVSFIQKNYPMLMDKVSTSVSPMIAAARLIKKTEKDAKVIFIGPCIAKKKEAMLEDVKDAVEYVLTFEELLAMLDAAEIQVKNCEEDVLDNASFYGRIFARSGGLSEAVAQVIKEGNIEADYRPDVCNGLKECDMELKLAKINRTKGNFIEGMACTDGCIGGPGCLIHATKNVKAINDYGKKAMEKEIKQAVKVFDISNVNLHRDYKKSLGNK